MTSRSRAPILLPMLLLALILSPACASTRGAEGEGASASSGPKIEPPFAAGGGAVIRAPIEGSPATAVALLFYTGSIDDPKGKEGLTALTAKLMAEGGTRSMTYAQLLRALYPIAAEIGAQADKEQTVFRATVHKDRAPELIPILAEVVLAPRFAPEDFERIRADMLNDIEKRLRTTDDENLGKELLNRMLYGGGHPYGHYVGGTVAGLKSITLDDVKAHAARVFGKKRLLIGIGGAVDPKLEEGLTAALAPLGEGDARFASVPRVEKPSKVKVVIAEKPGKAVAISMGVPHDAFRGHPDFSALSLLASYLGEHRQFHGLLMQEMREKRGLNYGDYAYVENFIQEGWGRHAATNIARRRQHFSIWIRPVDPKDAVLALRLASFYLDRTITAGVPDASVGPMRDFLLGYTLLYDLTPPRRLGFALDDHFHGIDGYLERYRADLAKLTKAEIDAAMRRHLVKGPLLIAMVAPDAQALKKEILSGAPSTKTYAGEVSAEVKADDAKVFAYPLGITEGDIEIVKVDDLFAR